MLISTVCKTHGLSRIIVGQFSVFSPFSPPTPVLRTAFTSILQSIRRVDSRGYSTRASEGGIRIDRLDRFLIFTSEPQRQGVSRQALRSSVPRVDPSNPIVSSDLCCERAGPSLVDHGVCVKLVAVSRRHQAVYCIQISLSFIITI